ncbi:potassium channel family protein [Kribbella sp. CA-253562]|uniref:potassium channel family protein n=1 Tax=Kribbella sp. CA-253562 TaxID=3239942 RepID=UPI003D93D309
MVAPANQELPRRVRRRLMVTVLVRAAVTAGGLGILYYNLPLGAPWSGRTAAAFAVGCAAVIVLIAWQARAIATADHPRVRAVEALATTLAYFLFLFAAAYFLIANSRPESFSEPLSRTGALYLTVTVFTSVGFGDIVPRTDGTRTVVMVQMLGSLALLGAGARVLLSAVQRGLRTPGGRDG